VPFGNAETPIGKHPIQLGSLYPAGSPIIRCLTESKRETKLPRLNVHRLVQVAVNVLSNLPPRIRPHSPLQYSKPQEAPARSLLDQAPRSVQR
jgi:hypothetical protein